MAGTRASSTKQMLMAYLVVVLGVVTGIPKSQSHTPVSSGTIALGNCPARQGLPLRIPPWRMLSLRGGGDTPAEAAGFLPYDPSAQVGVGMGIQMNKHGEHVITKLAKGWPAEQSGHIKEGDIIIDVNGTPSEGMKTEELMRVLKGLPGSCLSLLVQRGGSIESVELERVRNPVAAAKGTPFRGAQESAQHAPAILLNWGQAQAGEDDGNALAKSLDQTNLKAGKAHGSKSQVELAPAGEPQTALVSAESATNKNASTKVDWGRTHTEEGRSGAVAGVTKISLKEAHASTVGDKTNSVTGKSAAAAGMQSNCSALSAKKAHATARSKTAASAGSNEGFAVFASKVSYDTAENTTTVVVGAKKRVACVASKKSYVSTGNASSERASHRSVGGRVNASSAVTTVKLEYVNATVRKGSPEVKKGHASQSKIVTSTLLAKGEAKAALSSESKAGGGQPLLPAGGVESLQESGCVGSRAVKAVSQSSDVHCVTDQASCNTIAQVATTEAPRTRIASSGIESPEIEAKPKGMLSSTKNAAIPTENVQTHEQVQKAGGWDEITLSGHMEEASDTEKHEGDLRRTCGSGLVGYTEMTSEISDPGNAASERHVPIISAQASAGVGIEFEKNVHGDFMVTEIVSGGPAASNGNIEVGDILTVVDGSLLEGLTDSNVKSMLMGVPQTPVVMVFSRWMTGQKNSEGMWSERTIALKRSKAGLKTKLPNKSKASTYHSRLFRIDHQALDVLIEMGFPKADATRALYASLNKIQEAVEWLANNPNLEPIPEDSELCNSNDASGVNLAQARQLENAGVPLLLATNSNPVEDLVALGFTRMQVEKALRRTQGRVMLAADMLLEKQARKEKLLREQERRKRLGQGGITGFFSFLWSGSKATENIV